jgi:hypothetical protein
LFCYSFSCCQAEPPPSASGAGQRNASTIVSI